MSVLALSMGLMAALAPSSGAANFFNPVANPGDANYVMAWGDNSAGQSTVPASLTGKTIEEVAATSTASYALTSDGKITAWGDNGNAQIEVPTALASQRVTAISAGSDGLVYARTADARLWGWGCNPGTDSPVNGEQLPLLVQADPNYHPGPHDPPATAPVPVTDIASSGRYTVAVTATGALAAWGCDAAGEGAFEPDPLLTLPTGLTGPYVQVTASPGAFVAIRDVVGGDPSRDGDQAVNEWAPTAGSSGIVQTSWVEGASDWAGLGSDPSGWAWLIDSAGKEEYGWNDGAEQLPPASLATKTVTTTAGGTSFTLALANDKTVTAWGDDSLGQTSLPTPVATGPVAEIAAGGSHGLAIVTGTPRLPQADLALHAVASVSTGSVENGTWSTTNLTDGQLTSTPTVKGYSSDPAQPTANTTQSLTVDLGSVQRLGSLVLYPRTAVTGEDPSTTGAGFPASFTVAVSNDLNSWTTVGSYTGQSAADGQPRSYAFTPNATGSYPTGRYVRLQATQLGQPAADDNGYRLQLAELQVFGAPTQTDVALHASVAANSSLEDGVWAAANLTDGQLASSPTDKGYTSDPASPVPYSDNVVTLDFGAITPIDTVELYPRTAVTGETSADTGAGYPVIFMIETSTDGSNWTLGASTLTGTGTDGVGHIYGLASPVSARYLRIVTTEESYIPDESPAAFRMQLAEVAAYAY